MSSGRGYTLAEARARVKRDWLDDPNGTRWSNTIVDDALQSALTKVLDEYISETGGDRFMIEVEATSSSSGVVDLSALTVPMHVLRKVAVKHTESTRQMVHGIRPEDFGQPDNAARDLLLYYVPRYDIPTDANSGDPLVSVSGTRAPATWRAFEDVVIKQAAYDLRFKDPKLRPPRDLLDELAHAKMAVMSLPSTPRTRRFPNRKTWAPNLYWHWLPNAEQLVLSTRF